MFEKAHEIRKNYLDELYENKMLMSEFCANRQKYEKLVSNTIYGMIPAGVSASVSVGNHFDKTDVLINLYGDNKIQIRLRDGKLSADMNVCDYDVETFTEIMSAVQTIMNRLMEYDLVNLLTCDVKWPEFNEVPGVYTVMKQMKKAIVEESMDCGYAFPVDRTGSTKVRAEYYTKDGRISYYYVDRNGDSKRRHNCTPDKFYRDVFLMIPEELELDQ